MYAAGDSVGFHCAPGQLEATGRERPGVGRQGRGRSQQKEEGDTDALAAVYSPAFVSFE